MAARYAESIGGTRRNTVAVALVAGGLACAQAGTIVPARSGSAAAAKPLIAIELPTTSRTELLAAGRLPVRLKLPRGGRVRVSARLVDAAGARTPIAAPRAV